MKQVKLSFTEKLLEKTIFFSYTNIGYYLRAPFFESIYTGSPLEGKTAVITGATAGIGKYAALQLASLGAQVHIVGRDEEKCINTVAELKEKSHNSGITYHCADLSLISSTQALSDTLQQALDRLDILIHNAGVMHNDRIITSEGIEKTFSTNVLSGFQLTESLKSLLESTGNAKVISVSSGGMYATGYYPEDPFYEKAEYNGVMAYARTKRAQVLLTEYWAETYKNSAISFHAMHPGWVYTPGIKRSLPLFTLLLRPFLRTLHQGADTIVWLATADLDSTLNGSFWLDRKPRPTIIRKDTENSPEDIKKLVATCRQLCG